MIINSNSHWEPTLYASGADFQFISSKQVIDQLIIQQATSLLDIGSGDGRVTAYLSSKYANLQVTGMDISAKMVTFANAHYAKTDNLHFLQDDIQQQTAISVKQYNFITSFWAMSWLTDHIAAFENIIRFLSPRGGLYLLVPENNAFLYNTIQTLIDSARWSSKLIIKTNPKNSVCYQLYKSLYQTVGFSVKKTRFSFQFANTIHLEKYLKGWLPILQGLNQEEQNNLIADLVNHYNTMLSVQGQEANSVFFECIIISGNKQQ